MSKNNLHEIERISGEIRQLQDEIIFLKWLADYELKAGRNANYRSFMQELDEVMFILGDREREYEALIYEE
jgi:hypothetical protein